MAYIGETKINELREQINIVDIISEYVQLKKTGKNYIGFCPFHNDKNTPSFVVSPEKQIFNCFSCPAGGNVFSFIMKKEDINFVEAASLLARKVGYNLDIVTSEQKYQKNQFAYDMYELATNYYMNNLNTKMGLEAKEYLQKRGIDEETLTTFKFGLALNDRDTLYQIMNNKNYDLDTMEKMGLVIKNGARIYDTFQNRIMIPIEDIKGQVIAFTARVYQENDDGAKYINSRESIIFKKSNVLFNYAKAKDEIKINNQVIIVEGHMDAIKLYAKGVKNVIALMGVALSNEHINLLKKLHVPVVLMLDNDATGTDATIKLGALLEKNNIDTYIVRFSGAKDPDEYVEKNGIEALKDNINHAIKYIDYKMEYLKQSKNLDNMDDLISYVKEVINSLEIADELSKEVVLAKLSKDYNLEMDVLKSQLTNVKSEVKKEPIVSEQPKRRKTKYDKAVSKVLYGMMNNQEYIRIYKNKLGYLQNKDERIIACEIAYYNNKYENINVADFTTFIMNNSEIYDKVISVINENYDQEIDLKEFNDCIEVILNEIKKIEISTLKNKIKQEMDINKKIELLSRLTEIKKGSVDK